MKYEIRLLKLSEHDYNEIYEYLSQFYPSTPRKFTVKFEKCKENLEDNPYMYSVYEPMPQFRRFFVNDYIGFYKVFEEQSVVEIHRLLHSSRNILHFLKER
ncbi:MAG: type II toxin-antitoxin system RelE/ParE family toxin [Oscillospiraceae bacterium]|nr:type II toxin-antitoxin system RelE/ParE family toxin [Oscillospiraceae bacterium]